jgi:hypothetical protein
MIFTERCDGLITGGKHSTDYYAIREGTPDRLRYRSILFYLQQFGRREMRFGSRGCTKHQRSTTADSCSAKEIIQGSMQA